MKVIVNLFIMILLSSNGICADSAPELKRFDPHAKDITVLKDVSVKGTPECLACHTPTEAKLKSTDTKQMCVSCHQKSAHPGLDNHIGRKWTSQVGVVHQIDCISCHRPHRAKTAKSKKGLPKMIDHECLDCHKWDKLP